MAMPDDSQRTGRLGDDGFSYAEDEFGGYDYAPQASGQASGSFATGAQGMRPAYPPRRSSSGARGRGGRSARGGSQSQQATRQMPAQNAQGYYYQPTAVMPRQAQGGQDAAGQQGQAAGYQQGYQGGWQAGGSGYQGGYQGQAAYAQGQAAGYQQGYAYAQGYASYPGGPGGPSYPGGSGYGAPAQQPPRKKGGGGVAVAVILLIVGVALLVGAGYMWVTSQQKYQANEAEYHELAAANVTEDATTGRPVVDFAALQAQNPEIVGWLQIPGTAVNYPVVKHADNDYYLNHSFLGRDDEFGAIFMDYRSAEDLSGRNVVVYGHHLKNGEMFAQVADYSDQAEFDTLSNIYYVTQDDAVHVLVPLCTIVVSGYDVDVLQFDFATQADFEAYVQSLIDRSSARSSTAGAAGAGRIYMFSTCSYATDNERTILVCTDLSGTNGPVVDATQSMAEIQEAADEAVGA